MKGRNYIAILALANMLPGLISTGVAVGQSKNSRESYIEGRSKGTSNHNPQWSADPEQGWVRSDEVQRMRDRRNTLRFPKTTNDENNDKAKRRFGNNLNLGRK